LVLTTAPPPVESKFEQVAPETVAGYLRRSPGQTRAVVLIHGFHFHLSVEGVSRAEFRPWQKPDAPLVRELARYADVFAFAYGQDAALPRVAERSQLAEHVARLKQEGYRDIVLLGHSAGGLIARQLVEDHPDCGVTKVVQVCSPNAGCALAVVSAPRNQQDFLASLTPAGRQLALKERARVHIPAGVQFACVVARWAGYDTDGVVPCPSQWSTDLRDQGIPAITVRGSHRSVVRSPRTAEVLARVVREDEPRWSPDHVRQARKEVLGR
jgi:pimeloyl-ACP methyl ester carboxylesterase